MAKKIETGQGETDPLVSLNAEARKHIEDLGPQIEKSYEDLEAMESLGLESSMLREKLDWAKKARQVILDRLT